MKYPIYNNEMQEGGLIIDGVAPGWIPMEQFEKKGLDRIVYTGLRTIGMHFVRATGFCYCKRSASYDVFYVTQCCVSIPLGKDE